MTKMAVIGAAVMGALVSIGCRDQSQTVNGVGACNPANSGHDCIHLNGDGVHAARTMPWSASGLRGDRRVPWQLLGFSNAGGRVVANGWYPAIGRVDAEVTRAVFGREDVELRAVLAPETALRVEVAGPRGDVRSIEGAALADLVLTVAVPAPGGRGAHAYDLRFTPAGTFAGSSERFEPLRRYSVEFRSSGRGQGAWTSYCEQPDGEAMSATLLPGAQWSPDDGARTDGDHLVTLTCETGAVAQCALWGYVPWEHAVAPGSAEVQALAAHHQACIHMKRGAYCGTDESFTRAGTAIEVSDPFGIQGTSVGEVEAFWTPEGAACVSRARDPEAGFEGCPEPLPACPPSPGPGIHLVSGVVSPL
jgi:hypothetical protein